MALFKKSHEVAPICDRCGFPVETGISVLAQQRTGLAALTSEWVCNRASLVLGFVGHLDITQTVPVAEAEALALFHSCVVYALWITWGKKEPIGAYLDLYMARLLSKARERFGDTCLSRFKDIFVSREAEFMEEFPKIGKGDAALPKEAAIPVVEEADAASLRLAGRWVRRAKGTYDAELERSGLHTATDIVSVGSFFHFVTSAIVADSKLFRTTQGLFQ